MSSLSEHLNEFPAQMTIPVFWGDMDALGHVNNLIYFRWMETSRIDYASRVKLYDTTGEAEIGPILASTTCNFKVQTRFPDTIFVGARMGRVGRTSLVIEHRMVSQKQNAIVAEGTSTIVVFNYVSHKSEVIPGWLRSAIESLEGKEFPAASG